MTKTIEDLFIYFRIYSNIPLLIIFIIFIRRFNGYRGWFAIIASCLFDVIYYIIGEHFTFHDSIQTLFYASFTFIEYNIFAFFFWSHIIKKSFRKFIALISFFFTGFLIFYTIFAQFKSIDSTPIGIETILIFIYSFYYLYEQMNNTNNLFIYSHYAFWITSGIMIYLAGSFFIYIFANLVDTQTLSKYWFLTNALYVLKNIFFGIGMLTHLKPHSKLPTSPEPHPYLN
jgi:hypothetical protein